MKNLQAWSPILSKFREEVSKLFDLTIKPLKNGPEDLSNWYVNSFDEIIINAHRFSKDFRYEVTTLMCELIRSDYALNFLAGSKTILKRPLEDWSIGCSGVLMYQ